MRSCIFLLIACACATAAPPSKPAAEAAAAAAREPAATRIVSVLELRNKQQLRDGPGIDAGYVADRLRAEVLGAGVSTVAEWVQQALKTLGKECHDRVRER